MIRQELNPETCRLEVETNEKQVQVVDQTTHPPKCHSFVGLDRQIGSSPPALNLELERERTKEEKEREVLHLFRCYTHTHC